MIKLIHQQGQSINLFCHSRFHLKKVKNLLSKLHQTFSLSFELMRIDTQDNVRHMWLIGQRIEIQVKRPGFEQRVGQCVVFLNKAPNSDSLSL